MFVGRHGDESYVGVVVIVDVGDHRLVVVCDVQKGLVGSECAMVRRLVRL